MTIIENRAPESDQPPAVAFDPDDVAAIRRDALRALLMVAAFPVLVVVVIVAIVAFDVVVAESVHVGVYVLYIVSFFTVLALLRNLFGLVRPRRAPRPSGTLVLEEDQPELVQLVHHVAADVGTRPPDEIWLVPGTVAAVQEETLLLGLIVRRRRLVLGYALLSLLSREELVAVLAHEHGHFAGGDTRLRGSYRTRTAMALAAADFEGGYLGRMFSTYEQTHRRLSRRAGQLQERRADVRAVELTDAATLGRALCTSAVSGPLLDLFLETHVARLLHRNLRPTDLYEVFRSWCRLPEVRDLARQHLGTTLETPTDPDSTHPGLADRIEAVGLGGDATALRDGLLAPTPAPSALSLVRDETGTAASVVDAVLVSSSDVRTGPWQSLAVDALRQEWVDRARRLLTVAAGGRGSMPVGRFLDLIDREGVENLARTFVPDLDRRHEADRKALLRDFEIESVLTVTVAAMLQRGALTIHPGLLAPRGTLVMAGQPWSLSAEPSLVEGARGALRVGGVSPESTLPPASDLPATSRRLVRLLPNVGVRRKRYDLAVLDDRMMLFKAPAVDTFWHNLVVGYGDPGGFYRRRTAARVNALLVAGANGILTNPDGWTLPGGGTGVLQVKKQRWQIDLEAPDGQRLRIQGDPKAISVDELRGTFEQVLRDLTVR